MGRVESDSTHRRRVEGRSNPKPTAGKIGRFGFLSWLASVGSDRVPELKKASRSEEKACRNLEFSPETENSCRKLENFAGNWKIPAENWIFSEICFYFFARNCWVWPELAKSH